MLRNPPPTALGTYSLVVTTSQVNKLSPMLFGVAVQSSYATAVWLLAFSGTAVPADGTVPIMAPIAVAVNARNIGLSLTQGLPISANGLVLVASSTPDTLTKDVAATLDITAFIEEFEEPPLPGSTAVGDLTTAVKSLAVWTDANGPKRLLRVLVKNNAAAVRYACVYATNSPATTDKILTFVKIAASDIVEINFGHGGFDPQQVNSDFTINDGCTIWGQSVTTPGTLMAATDFNIKAWYI